MLQRFLNHQQLHKVFKKCTSCLHVAGYMNYFNFLVGLICVKIFEINLFCHSNPHLGVFIIFDHIILDYSCPFEDVVVLMFYF